MKGFIDPRARLLLVAEYEASANYRAAVDVRDATNEAFHAPALLAITRAFAQGSGGMVQVAEVVSFSRSNRIAMIDVARGIPAAQAFIGRKLYCSLDSDYRN